MQSLLLSNQNIALTASTGQRKILVYNPEYHGNNFGKLWVLGPNYRASCTPFWKCIKEEALNHVLRSSQCSLPEIINEIGNIEADVRAVYDDNLVSGLQDDEFQQIMAVDGCFFLLLAFSILGAGRELKFPDNHLVFGTGCVTAYMQNWLESMFFIGNQIPFIVLEKLMGLSIFKGLKTSLKFKQHQELEKRTLYNFLIVNQNPKPTDLIHCLQSVMLGPKAGSNTVVGKKNDDLEDTVSAIMLSKRGTRFRKLDGELGIRGMRFESNAFGDVLHLPVLKVDRYTGLLVKCLLKYEIVQEPQGVEPEAIPFFKFMCELIHTSQDIAFLESEGVIQGQSGSLQGILRTLHDMVSFGNMHCVKSEIVGNRPWQWRKLLKWAAFICSVLFFLFAFMQMNYGILAYYKRGNT